MHMSYAYLFPGQGAQHVGMGKGLYDACDVAREIFQQANRTLGYDITACCFDGDPADLMRTDRCQPAIYVVSIAAWQSLQARGVYGSPVASAGLSLGEYAAITAAGGWSIEDGLRLVHIRGTAMEGASQQRAGTMTALVGLELAQAQELCQQTETEVANLNSPGQIVVSGALEGIERLEPLAKAAGAKRVIRLDVGGAFHSSLMEPARQEMAQALQRIDMRALHIPVVCNVTAQPTQDAEQLRTNLIGQLTKPTLWVDSMRHLASQGVGCCIEFAPAKILAGLLRRIDKSLQTITLNEPSDYAALTATSSPS